MSVYGGDSWVPEAQQRKRRVDDLFLDGFDSSSFKTLSNGKFTCLVCPNRPLLDSSLMLSMHNKGARHRAELSRLKEKDLIKRNEINKRIALTDALSDNPIRQGFPGSSAATLAGRSRPLIEHSRKAVSELRTTNFVPKSSENQKAGVGKASCDLYTAQGFHQSEQNSLLDPKVALVASTERLDFRERQEKELKFTAAGWKRDGYGGWYRDENVEFDSDEEDPNTTLA